MNEVKLDRRAHWIYWAIGLVVAITSWCVRLQMTQNQQSIDMAAHVAARDAALSKIWDRLGSDHDRITLLYKDVEWLKRERH